MFKNIKWMRMQQPLLLLVSMVTGKNVTEFITMNVYDRLVLARAVLIEVVELVSAGIDAVDPAGPGGVTMTEEEWERIVDEADDPKAAVMALLGKDAPPA